MLNKFKDMMIDLFKKAPKGFVTLPIAVAALVLATVIAVPFLGSDSDNDDNTDNVISFHDKENFDEEDNLDIDASAGGDKDNNDSEEENGDSTGGTGENSNGNNSSGSNDNSQSGNADGGSTSGPNNSTSSNSGDSGSNGNTNNSGSTNNSGNTGSTDLNVPGISISNIPAFSGTYSIKLNNGKPYFSTTNLSTTAFEYYSDLDSLKRCGVAYACLGPELLPTEERGDISSVKPSGWIQAQYSCVPGASLWNRSHLIAFSLAGENANVKNLITGTQHMNQEEMTVYESMVLAYIKETGGHVLYRVTPHFEGNNLVATGVQMEAWSIEDNGESICFNVFLYNVQDGIIINYATGESKMTDEAEADSGVPSDALYVVNGNSGNGKIHKVSCKNAQSLSNPIYCATLEEAIAESERIMGTAQYAGCCMKDYQSNHDDGSIDLCHLENRQFLTMRLFAALINTKQQMFFA